jgi:hypothetical protein
MSLSKRTGPRGGHFGRLLATSADEAHHDEVAVVQPIAAEVHDHVADVGEPELRGVQLLNSDVSKAPGEAVKP